MLTRIYIGTYRIRMSSGVAYFHVPIKLVHHLGTRRVRVIMRVDSRGCNDLTIHGSLIIFPATLTRIGDTFRIKIPKKFYLLANKIKDCGLIEVWLEPDIRISEEVEIHRDYR